MLCQNKKGKKKAIKTLEKLLFNPLNQIAPGV
jgi:hypothetical protein